MIRIIDNNSADDLGSGEPIKYNEFPLMILKVAYILRDLKKVLNENNFRDALPSYGFRLSVEFKGDFEKMRELMKEILPQGVDWYETDGKWLFEMRGYSGGVTSSLVCYLIAK